MDTRCCEQPEEVTPSQLWCWLLSLVALLQISTPESFLLAAFHATKAFRHFQFIKLLDITLLHRVIYRGEYSLCCLSCGNLI